MILLIDFLQSFRTSLIVGLILILIFVLKKGKGRSRFPSGPRGLPYLGYLFPVIKNRKKLHVKLFEIGEKHGDIYSLKVGALKFVVLNSAKAIRESLSKPELFGRPNDTFSAILPMATGAFFNNNGKIWHEHRTYALQTFKEMGVGKTPMEEKMKDEISHFLEFLTRTGGAPAKIKSTLHLSVANVLTEPFFGVRYNFEDPERKYLHNVMLAEARDLRNKLIIWIFPWLTSMFSYYSQVSDEKVRQVYDDFVKRNIQKCKANPNPEDDQTFLERYVYETQKRKLKDPNTTLSEDILPKSLTQLYTAGTETTRITITWLLYTMASYPEVQRKIHEELDEVVGQKRTPSFGDQKHLPYTISVMMEVQRWQTVVPLSVPRLALADVSIRDYVLPAGTVVFTNLYAAHNDPHCWKDPRKFIPDRFLSPDRKSVVRNENYMPFSYGKRNCFGEGWAIMEVFLYFTCIMQNFTVKLPDGETPDFEGTWWFLYDADKTQLCFHPRQ